jgi:BatD DUF11 like domain
MKPFLLATLFALSAVVTSAQTPVIRAKFAPAKGIIVGQPVHLIVEVLVPNFFTDSPDFPTFELENAIVVLPQETPQNFNEQINGQSYAGIRQTYFLYPQQPGDFRLPPAQFGMIYASAPPKTTVAHLTLPPLTFHAEIPAAASDLSYFLPTTSLTMQQKWSSPLTKLRVGDTIERTITVTTTRMQGMLIPPLPLEAPEGIRIYSDEPKVQDQKTDRGEFIFGRRTEKAKYLIQKEGDYTLPAIELKWWNLTSNRLVTTTIPATHFIAAANPNYIAELPPEPEIVPPQQPKPVSLRGRYLKIAVAAPFALATFFLIWFVYKFASVLTSSLKAKREQRLHSEATYFHNLIRASQHNDAQPAYQWLVRWLAHSTSKNTLSRFLERSNDPELTHQVNALTETLFAKNPQETWNGRIMATSLRKLRPTLPSKRRQQTSLPLLNP